VIAPAVAPASASPSQPPKPAAPPAPRDADAEVRSLLAQWLAAQNDGDFERYAALYAARFTGVRRTGDKTRAFDRAGWLADRKRMFAKPMQVKAGELQIAHAGPSAVVRFEQEWSTATYRDVGPKQMVLVREPAGLRITREELLSSAPLPAGGSSARFVTSIGARSYVLLEPAPDEPPGKPLAVELSNPSAALFEHGGAVRDPNGIEAWRSGPLLLISAHGVCQASAGALRRVAVGYPHFGVIQTWKGEGAEGEPAAPTTQVAAELAGMYGTWIALEIEHLCVKDAVLALPAGAPVPTVFAPVDVDTALRARGQQAFAALPAVRKLTREEREELDSAFTMAAFGRERPEWLVAAAATGCAMGIAQLALFRVEGDRLVPQLTSTDSELFSIWALLDLDGDGEPEIAGTPWAPTPWLVIDSRKGRVLQSADIPYNDCPC
jgi:ketosteroid isomerase-like protein